MAGRSSRVLPFLITLAALAVVMFLARTLWLPVVGYALIHADGPAHADIAVVLAGDYWGNRISKAGDLVREGYVPAALVDGPSGFYGMHESDLAIRYAVSKGYPESWFINFPMQANSTQEEARVVVPELRRRNVHSFLLVTSDFHSARARRIFLAAEKEAGYAPGFRTVVSHGPDFNPDNWWRYREGKKTAFIEWCKTLGTALGQ